MYEIYITEILPIHFLASITFYRQEIWKIKRVISQDIYFVIEFNSTYYQLLEQRLYTIFVLTQFVA